MYICNYIYKWNTRGEMIPYKARLVAKGFTQTASIDMRRPSHPLHDPTRSDQIPIAATYDWESHQIDIKSAYLNGSLDKEIYMDQPRGFKIQGNLRVRKGLKYATQLHTALAQIHASVR